ncbi:MAG: hypothetical protein JST75_09495 [Bacteroidetes bacterium]|nr:hypothetical protein [Bacteroidota bacterium]
MKKNLIIIFFVPLVIEAQTFEEWFQQKKTDIKYLGEQILALNTYIKYAEKGYEIAREGLDIVGKIKNGEFNLHSLFFGEMKRVNPAIAKYAKAAGIISYQEAINRNISRIRNAANMNEGEMDYLRKICNNLKTESAKNMDMLLNLVTEDQLTINDGQRIGMIDKLYIDVKDQYAFSEFFLSQVKVLSADRQFETNDNELLQNLY